MTRQIAKGYNFKNVKSYRFDYLNPTALEAYVWPRLNKAQNVLYISSHSVEQVSEIGTSMFKSIIEVSPYNNCYFLHIEPVGWQLVEPALKSNIYVNPNYNKDLCFSLYELHQKGLIEITSIEINKYGKANNPATIISWKSRRGK